MEGSLGRLVYVPLVWVKPGDPVPVCLDCRTPFRKTVEYPQMVGYEADCMEKHDPERIANEERAKLWI